MTEQLAVTAIVLGVTHTILGPDHYLPFVFLAKAGDWSRAKTLVVTALCGLGHVLGSVVLGGIGILLGLAVSRLEAVEAVRGDWAAWVLIAFGLVYFAWGLRRARRHRGHGHLELDQEGRPKRRLTPWVLFIIFVLGPCEPLIPLLMYPAARHSAAGVVLVAALYGLATIVTMLLAVALCLAGLDRLPLERIERYAHAIAGAAVALCGVAIHLGL